jgi:O-methyltransferase involved in polyketide biosynthesis
MGKPLIENVSDTAFMVAVYRAIETARPDALFHDFLADRLAGDHGRRIVASLRSSLLGPWSVVVRTCIIDDFMSRPSPKEWIRFSISVPGWIPGRIE